MARPFKEVKPKSAWRREPIAVVALLVASLGLIPPVLQYFEQRRGTETGQRAYVVATAADFAEADKIGQRARVTVILKNYGTTPASEVRPTCVLTLGPEVQRAESLEKLEAKATPSQSVAVMANGESQRCETAASTETTAEHLAAIGSRSIRWYAHGNVTYRDVFDVPHRSTYCFEFDPVKSEMARVCKFHNDVE